MKEKAFKSARGLLLGITMLVIAAAVTVMASRNGARADTTASIAAETVSLSEQNVYVVANGSLLTGPVISGSLQPERKASVRAEVGGAVLSTLVEVGQAVQRGQAIGRIDDAAIRDNVQSASSAVRAADAAAVNARRNVERMEALVKAGAVADRAVEDARTAALAADRMLADAKAALAQADKVLGKTVLRAPISGVVSERPVSAGDIVQPGAPLFVIVDPASMQLEASLPSEQLGLVRVGADVKFNVKGYAQPFTGRVSRISPVADPVTRQVRVFVSIPNGQNRLVGGLFAEGRVADETRDGLVAPISAIQAIDGRGSDVAEALRVKNGVVERVELTIGLRDDRAETVEITAGVSAGDTLLIGAARSVTVGTPVSVAARTASAPVAATAATRK